MGIIISDSLELEAFGKYEIRDHEQLSGLFSCSDCGSRLVVCLLVVFACGIFALCSNAVFHTCWTLRYKAK